MSRTGIFQEKYIVCCIIGENRANFLLMLIIRNNNEVSEKE